MAWETRFHRSIYICTYLPPESWVQCRGRPVFEESSQAGKKARTWNRYFWSRGTPGDKTAIRWIYRNLQALNTSGSRKPSSLELYSRQIIILSDKALSKRSFAVRTRDRRLGAFDFTTAVTDRANPLLTSLGCNGKLFVVEFVKVVQSKGNEQGHKEVANAWLQRSTEQGSARGKMKFFIIVVPVFRREASVRRRLLHYQILKETKERTVVQEVVDFTSGIGRRPTCVVVCLRRNPGSGGYLFAELSDLPFEHNFVPNRDTVFAY
jgi:hypothetical protein